MNSNELVLADPRAVKKDYDPNLHDDNQDGYHDDDTLGA